MVPFVVQSVPDPGSGDFLTPGSGMGKKKSRFGIIIRDEHPGSYFRELRNNFLIEKYLNSFMWNWMRNLFDPGSGMEKFASGKRNKHFRIRNTGCSFDKGGVRKFICSGD
jgi:hypothetical protein